MTHKELADQLLALDEKARATADDIRYYSGGSSHNEDEEVLLRYFREHLPFIVAALRSIGE